jgi:antitoxin MazE
MTTKIKMWGNSLGVRIPKHVSDELRLREGSEVQVALQGRIITVKPTKQEKHVSLRELVSKITKKNRHGEEWGSMKGPVGHEVW